MTKLLQYKVLHVNRQPSTVNRQPSTVNRQPSTVNRHSLHFIQNYVYSIYLIFIKSSCSFLVVKKNQKTTSFVKRSKTTPFILQNQLVKLYSTKLESLLNAYIKNYYLKKVFIRLNISIYIFIKTMNCYFAIFTYKKYLLFVCQNKLNKRQRS